MITLRPYQQDAIRQITQAFASGAQAPLFVLPTGGGKTKTFAHIAHSAERRGRRVLILAHRIELVDQIVESLKNTEVIPDVIAAGFGRGSALKRPVAVASVQTLVRRLADYAMPSLIIIDECHHVTTGSAWGSILRHYHTARRLGVTATPIRLDGRGLAAHFDRLIVGPSVRELTEWGFLAPARIFAPPTVDTSGLAVRAGEFSSESAAALMDTKSITGDALSHYRKYADGKPALIFCTSVKHAANVATLFREGGVSAVDLNGGAHPDIRRMAVQDFRDGKLRVLTSCDLFSEGFDVPGVHVGILLRPTASEGLWRQQIGRVLRPAPGKTHAIILDHVNCTYKFGLPDTPREWSLTDDVARKKKAAPGVKICAKCFAASAITARECAECGAKFPGKPRAAPKERDGELVELTPDQLARQAERRIERQNQGRSQTLEQLREFGKRKGYSEGWAQHVWDARQRVLARKHG